jgi:acyl-CoA thioester hydrolase
MPSAPDTPLEAYPMHYTERLRYGDTDRQGHINNAAYATFCESGRVAFMFDPDHPMAPPGTNFVIVRLAIDYKRELHWPGEVVIGTGVTRIGGKSVTLAQGIFRDGVMAAAAENVLAIMDDTTRRAIEIPATTRARLEALRMR